MLESQKLSLRRTHKAIAFSSLSGNLRLREVTWCARVTWGSGDTVTTATPGSSSHVHTASYSLKPPSPKQWQGLIWGVENAVTQSYCHNQWRLWEGQSLPNSQAKCLGHHVRTECPAVEKKPSELTHHGPHAFYLPQPLSEVQASCEIW